MLRIAHVISTPYGVGGAERTLAQLVSHGGRQGWSQLVLNPFAIDPYDPRHRELYAPAHYEGHRGETWRDLPELRRWLASRLELFAPQIVHAHLFHASVLVASVRRPAGARLVLSHQHGNHFQATGSRLYELLDRIAGRRYDRIVGCSRSVEDHLVRRYGYSNERVCHVHNGWSGQPSKTDCRGHSIICVARLRTQKNHRMLIDAVARVRARVPDVRLQLVGDGETRPEVEDYVRKVGLSGSVEFLGDVDDVWPLLAGARVFALASTYEPLGISVLEAMAAGVPVVATAVGGLREIVDDGETGFLVSPHDVTEFADRLMLLLIDDQLAASMARRARETAATFHADRMAEGYARVYAGVLNGR